MKEEYLLWDVLVSCSLVCRAAISDKQRAGTKVSPRRGSCSTHGSNWTAVEIKPFIIDTNGSVHISRRCASHNNLQKRPNAFPSFRRDERYFLGFCAAAVFLPVADTSIAGSSSSSKQENGEGGGREGGRHTGKAHWQSLGHGPQLLASTQHNRWRLSLKRRCTQTLPVDLARCGFGRRWEETAQRGHNYSAAASTASTSSFCRREFDQTIYSQLCVIMKLTANK